MSYFIVSDFKAGLDRRRMAATGAPGTLRTLRNAAVNRGGEIEKRKALVPVHRLPAGTYGLAVLDGSTLTVFGTDPTVSPPVNYIRVPPDGKTLRRVLFAQMMFDVLFWIAEWTDGTVKHYSGSTAITAYSGRPDAAKARYAIVHGEKAYLPYGKGVYASEIQVLSWNAGAVGEAFYDMSIHMTAGGDIVALAEYLGQMAIFHQRGVQTWNFEADPVAASPDKKVPRIGCVAPRTAVSFAGQDVFFLSPSGIKSLRSRDSAAAISAADIGNPIDSDVVEAMRTLSADSIERAFAEVEPTTDRYWLALGNTAYVFSYFPGAKVSAWSTYDLPTGATDFVALGNQMWVRAGDVLYLYGGEDGATYDDTVAEVETPYLDGRQIATWKAWKGIDIVAEGSWKVYASFNPNDPAQEDLIATLDGTSVVTLDQGMAGWGPVVKLRLVTTGSGAAKLGSLAVHYTPAEGR